MALLTFHDDQVRRFDVARIHRAAQAVQSGVVMWERTPVVLDPELDVLVVDDALVIEIERVVVRLPNGRAAGGPVLARCPRGCGRRARVLWEDPLDEEGFLACRKCVGVVYATAATGSERVRAQLAYDRLRKRLGLVRPWQTFERRKHQRRAAYERLSDRLDLARARLDAAIARGR